MTQKDVTSFLNHLRIKDVKWHMWKGMGNWKKEEKKYWGPAAQLALSIFLSF